MQMLMIFDAKRETSIYRKVIEMQRGKEKQIGKSKGIEVCHRHYRVQW